jgi:hypothetical protein
MTDQNPKGETPTTNSIVETLRISRAFWLSIIGLILAVTLVITLIIAGWDSSSDIVAVVGLFTSVLGTLVGAFFGLQIGASGTAKAEKRADDNQKKVEALSAAADRATIDEAIKRFPGFFS